MQDITEEQRKPIFEALRWFDDWFRGWFLRVLSYEIPHYEQTNEVSSILGHAGKLIEVFKDSPNLPSATSLDLGDLACLKRILLNYRRVKASEFERHKARTIHLEVIEGLEARITPFDELLQVDWLQKVEALRLPRLSEFVPIQQLEPMISRHTTNSWQLQQPFSSLANQLATANMVASESNHQQETAIQEYDEKFHILRAPGLFSRDLEQIRRQCDMRNTSVVISYIDIDDFKSFNTKYGEIAVDRIVLPTFMSVLEAHIFAHGYAYRHGGDEYLLLLPNTSFEIATVFLDQLRRDLATVKYKRIPDATTVSIGFCCVPPDCFLTDQEVVDRANKAKGFAKKQQGKNCIATFEQNRFDDESLYIIKPPSLVSTTE